MFVFMIAVRSMLVSMVVSMVLIAGRSVFVSMVMIAVISVAVILCVVIVMTLVAVGMIVSADAGFAVTVEEIECGEEE